MVAVVAAAAAAANGEIDGSARTMSVMDDVVALMLVCYKAVAG